MASGQPTADGLYLNELQVGNPDVMPQFKRKKEDAMALSIFRETFGSKYTTVPFDARKIAEGGGVLNCASRTVKV